MLAAVLSLVCGAITLAQAADPGWSDAGGPTEAVFDGILVEGISSVRVDKKGRAILLHRHGLKALAAKDIPLDFLRAWGIDPDVLNQIAADRPADAPPPNATWSHIPSRLVQKDAPYDAWADLWVGCPKPGLLEVQENPARFTRNFVLVDGFILEMSSQGDEFFMHISQGGERLWVAFSVFAEAARRTDSLRDKFELLCRLPQDGTQRVWIAGEVGRFSDTKSGYVELVDFRLDNPDTPDLASTASLGKRVAALSH